jgi:hypothetical protein
MNGELQIVYSRETLKIRHNALSSFLSERGWLRGLVPVEGAT